MWKTLLTVVLGILPYRQIITIFCDWLRKEVKKTPNEYDDAAVDVLETMLNTFLNIWNGDEAKEKLNKMIETRGRMTDPV